jgi:putative heme transporter
MPVCGAERAQPVLVKPDHREQGMPDRERVVPFLEIRARPHGRDGADGADAVCAAALGCRAVAQLPEPEPPHTGSRRLRRAVGPAVGLVVVVAIFAAVFPQFANYRAVLDAMTDLGARDWALIAICITLNIATGGLPWMAAVPQLGYGRAMLLTQTSSLMTTVLPMGEAVGFGTQIAMLRKWRFGAHAVTAGFLLVALWNQGGTILLPTVAIAVLGAGHTNPLYLTISLIAGAVLVVIVGAVALTFRSAAQARRIGDFAGRVVSRILRSVGRPERTGWGERLVEMRSETIGVVSRHWAFLTVATIANQLTLFGVLLASLNATNVTGISFFEALAAWAFARLIGSTAITPGGLGIQELGLTGALIAFGGETDEVVATALLFRVLTFVPTIVVGSACALIWRHQARRPSAA